MRADDASRPADNMPRDGRALRPWAELLRAPNLLTVPGDALVGVAVASAAGAPVRVWLAAGAAGTLLYAGGLVQNDLADRRRDAQQRPGRPIPSGRVRPKAALAAMVALLAGGLATAAACGPWTLATAGALVTAICLYNLLTKRWPVVGPLTMGLCRALSVCVGLAAGAEFVAAEWPGGDWPGLSPQHFAPAALIGLYVMSVTAIARRENRSGPVGAIRNFPACILAVPATWAVLESVRAAPAGPGVWGWWASLAALIAAGVWTGRCTVGLGLAQRPADVQRNVGRLIRGLLLIQAWVLLAAGGPGLWLGAALIAGFVAFGPLARRFAPS